MNQHSLKLEKIEGGQNIGALVSTSVLPMNILCVFPLGLTGLISLKSKRVSRVFFSTTIENISSSVLSHLYDPTALSIHPYWENNGFDYLDLCRQSDVSAF